MEGNHNKVQELNPEMLEKAGGGSDADEFKCRQCGAVFDTFGQYRDHMEKAHSPDYAPIERAQPESQSSSGSTHSGPHFPHI